MKAFILDRLRVLLILLIAAAIWLPCLHIFFVPGPPPSPGAIGATAEKLLARHWQLWTEPVTRDAELAKMQQRNPEWDFMSRTFFVLSLANLALRNPARATEACAIMDDILDHTLLLEKQHSQHHFLLGYSRGDSWVIEPARSLFVDGEIALMLGVRRLIREKPEYQSPMRQRLAMMVSRMRTSPVLCAESYPDECWLFCNTVALAAIRIGDVLDGSDHSVFLADWVRSAKVRLTEPETGLLISAFGVDGTPAPAAAGPEGSTIWTAAHLLQIVDAGFARDQYQRARRELGRSLLGFGYAREWPESLEGSTDIDSGPIIPLLEASAGSSGQAILGAAAFGDDKYLHQLLTSLSFGGFPKETHDQLRYCASNPVGDAVILYAMLQGPLWADIQKRAAEARP